MERRWGAENGESAGEKRERARELESRKKNTVGDAVGDEDLEISRLASRVRMHAFSVGCVYSDTYSDTCVCARARSLSLSQHYHDARNI